MYTRLILWAIGCVVLLNGSLVPQTLNHPLSLYGGAAASYISGPDVPDTLTILAIMVQFQPDTDSRTTGAGEFLLSADDQTWSTLNPPPHDADYFRHHLEFARRYYDRVSGGRLYIDYTVWDRVFSLPEQMEAYSPQRTGDFTEIGKLFEESWLLAADESPEIPFHEYDTFIIFHAGVGRDVDLTSIFGFDPTPFDIPSLYLGLQGLQRIFGESYPGIEVGDTGFHISNSMILPETQNRRLVRGGELPALELELAMNGLVCAMIGSRLGLPDLFNTDTGRSGIGRFGLMDGQAIFSFMGLFPPELSAWEKYYLGWLEPFDVPPGDHGFELSAVTLRNPASVLRVPINSREYYLVENRHRDPHGTGVTITAVYNGQITQVTYDLDTPGFNAFDISAINGVVIDVDVYDWSLPGGYNAAEDIFYDGGILVWHIDEQIINERIAENRINADMENKGVRVVEADGSQDIGREFGFLQAGQGSEDGTAFDYWYEENPAPIYENRFDASTIPPAVSNTGAPGNIAIYEFGPRAPVMGLRVRVGTELVSVAEGFPLHLTGATASTSPVPFHDGILFVDDGKLRAVDMNGVTTHVQANEDITVTGTPAWTGGGTSEVLFTQTGASAISEWRVAVPVDEGGIRSFFSIETYDIGETITAGPALLENGACLVGTENGNVLVLAEGDISTAGSLSENEKIIGLHLFPGGGWAAAGPGAVLFDDGMEHVLPAMITGTAAYVENGEPAVAGLGMEDVFIVRQSTAQADGSAGSGALSAYRQGDGNVQSVSSLGRILTGIGTAIAADVDRDGLMDVIAFRDDFLYAFNTGGAVLDHFPHRYEGALLFDTAPVAADIDGSGAIDVIVSNDRNMLGFHTADGGSAAGTPVAVGERIIGSPAVLNRDGKMALAVITADDLLYVFRFSGEWNNDSVVWGEEKFDSRRTNTQLHTLPRQPISDEFLPARRAYNWPNPIYDDITNIRYYLNEDAAVTISIYQMNGDRVTTFSGPGTGGMDNEVQWNASGVASGVYLGRIEARSENNSEVVFIKIAIVR
jgi:hypothetical protein